MEGKESILEAIYEESEFEADEETLGADGLQEDVEMLDAETLVADGGRLAGHGPPSVGGFDGGGDQAGGGGSRARNQRRRANKKKNRRKKKGGAASTITDINRFVIDTCRRLKEKKSYLVWNAIGCLGVLAISDLVKEVEAIQSCGGRKTVDGRRFRTGGGILWNILKTREPNVYKEIMAKGKAFERQFRHAKAPQVTGKGEIATSQSTNAPVEVAEEMDGSEQMADINQQRESSDTKMDRKSVLDRLRVPVAYDDLFEEGEIRESA
ncbi:uncharacterized protein [Elaeis guineensis]|uniref:Phosphorylated adapter RNA export protein n=1 Tax=Elaeis guineensis var. tenera TaxID=51953 RepID=A0A6I9REE5_ELAGV|nr:uncharacterized protein LOC105047630 [Elaeis guineensis]